MKVISIFFIIFFGVNSFAQNKLDELDKQSQEFFNAITGLEQSYLQEQIKKKKDKIDTVSQSSTPTLSNPTNTLSDKQLTVEEYQRNILENENDMARLASDVAKTKNLRNIEIKSLYEFNGKNYVVLKQKSNANNQAPIGGGSEFSETTMNIEGRYKKGDLVLNHRIVYINTRTKTVTLYKKLDDNYGYFVYVNNQGISLSDLKKVEKKKEKVKVVSVQKKEAKKEKEEIKVKKLVIENSSNSQCIYQLRVSQLNVRDNQDLDGTILRILRKYDKIEGQKLDNKLLISKIYKYKSGDVMDVKNQNNWVGLSKNRFNSNNENCF